TLRLHRHPDRLPRPPQPAGDHPVRDPPRRHRSVQRPDPAPHGTAGRDHPRLRGPPLRHHPSLRDALRPLQDLQPREAEARLMATDMGWWAGPLAIIGGAIRISTPFLFVSLGETITEKSGRINLGLEGTLVFGAMIGYAVAYLLGNSWAQHAIDAAVASGQS